MLCLVSVLFSVLEKSLVDFGSLIEKKLIRKVVEKLFLKSYICDCVAIFVTMF